MGSFVGTYLRNLDPKNRLILPSKLRCNLGNKIVVTLWLKNVIDVRSMARFDSLCEKLEKQNLLNENISDFKRVIFTRSMVLKVDALGRILLPAIFLERAAIKKDVAVLGVGDKLEIWNLSKYQAFERQNARDDSLQKIVDKLSKAGVQL